MAEGEGKLIRSLRSQFLDLPPSCVEFCPAFPTYFLVGTYSLQPDNAASSAGDATAGPAPDADSDTEGDGQQTQPKQPQSRNGSIIAFKLSDGIV
jgi:diphthamide biosynthesis protein 7